MGPSMVDVPLGSQTLNHDSLAVLPGSLRTATIRPLSAAATSSHFSVAPEVFTTGAARRTFCAPSSEDSHTSPLSTYAIEAALASLLSTSANARVARTRKARMSGH